ncbi:MAG: YicC family protein [Gammaproteobacteria bacterium]|nr:YicC family protein [Gammaproteobacteria bacterium]NNF62233.1 YicC family protein [Gammaproteobacteria bacterium]NNM21030.1 YicC family protein [Gammaproteobacteria bacterium]
MIRSMTAFARRSRRTDWGEIVWEIRTVNHRYLEMGFRLPEDLRSIEPGCRKAIAASLRRGKVDCSLKVYFSDTAATDLQLNEPLLDSVIARTNDVARKLKDSPPISPLSLMRWPGVVTEPERDLGPVEEAALALLREALDSLSQSRADEGGRIRTMLLERCDGIAGQVTQVRARLPEVRARMRDKLTTRLGELAVEYDRDRLEQELVMLAQKMDVDEELDRLESHIVETRNVLERDDAVGRRLDFLMQEFNREANTLGSKSNDAETTRAAVDIKVLVEQMREQVQNIE